MVSFRYVHIDLKESIRTFRDGCMEWCLPIPVCDHRPGDLDEVISEVVHVDLHTSQRQFAAIHLPTSIPIDQGCCTTLSYTIYPAMHSKHILKQGKEHQGNSEYRN